MRGMRFGFAVLISVLLLLVLLLSCAPKATPTPTLATPTPAATPRMAPAAPAPAPEATPAPRSAPATPAWQGEWDRISKAAKDEGRIIGLSTAGSAVTGGLRKAFKDKFGIELEITSGRDAEFTTKFTTERNAGIYNYDVYVGGSTAPVLTWKPRGLLKSLDGVVFLPEVIDQQVWKYYEGVFYDKGHRIAGGWATVKVPIHVNPKYVKPGEMKSFKDLLDPRWKGKITINDPTIEGAGPSTMSTIKEYMGVDFITKLVQQDPVIVRDKRQQVEWLVKGKYPVTLAATDSLILEYTRAGAEVTPIIPEEGAYITTANGCVLLWDRAPHPNGAKLFINWILTKEGQSIFGELAGHASRRADVSNEWLSPEQRPQPGVRYITFDEEMKLKEGESMKLYRETFKSLM